MLFEPWLTPWNFRRQPPPPVYCWAQMGTLWSCTSPDSFLARVPWVSARAWHRAPCLGMRLWRVALCFVKTKPTTRPRQPSKACWEGWQASFPSPKELREAPAATLAGTGDLVGKAPVQLWPPGLTPFSLD